MHQLKTRREGALAWISISSTNNTIGTDLLRGLDCILDELSHPNAPKTLIVRGDGTRFFSPGLDLYEVSQMDRHQMSDLIRSFSRLSLKLFTHPKRTLAMLNGHALAGGFLLASCCDFRFGHEEVRVGLTDLSRSLLMPFASMKILEYLTGPETAKQMARQGLSLTAAEALNIGWMDGIFSLAELPSVVKMKAAALAQKPELAGTSRALNRQLLAESIEDDANDYLEPFLDSWFSPETQTKLQRTVFKLRRQGEATNRQDGEREL
jgi:enoyl-CoA hydratase/carnithine racemase